jgi:hypothetical protein
MKTFKYVTLLFLSLGLFASCSDDDPDAVNEEEVITTVTLALTPQGGGTTVVFQSRDLDGDGPDQPIISVTGDLMANTQYEGTIEFLNELEDPAEDITTEVFDEGDEHQVIYTFNGTSGTSITYDDMDEDGNPIGLMVLLNSGTAADNNMLTVVLKHEPTKPNDGTIAGAGGETDVEATFTYNVN